MPIKTFKLHDTDLIDNIINDWEQRNGFKIDSISTCPMLWNTNKELNRVIDMELLIMVNYHKKRKRKEDNDEQSK